ncbi:MAG TPA: DUF2461 domain-containing protein [Bacteroidales bacterium]|nr:DUF2461 domain-containing protein [Bacteroidales bacterium]
MIQIQTTTLDFLNLLMRNNNKEWFDKHRTDYLAAKANFESFVQALLNEITGFDPIMKGLEAKSCIFRINRDIRFSHDKSPYKTNMGAFMVKGGKKNGDKFAGYYFHIEPGKSMLAGGAYLPPAQWLTAIREKIDDEPATLLKAINTPEFKKYFGQLEGEKLKKAPKGFDPGHKYIELLKFKSFLAIHNPLDKQILGSDYLKYSAEVFRAMKPLNDFLNEY